MSSFLRKLLYPFVFVSFFLLIAPLSRAQAPSDDPFEELLTKVRSIENQVQRIEANHREIIARQDRILAELERLRVWIHRR